MPDITMCAGAGCPLKDSCYRFKATPSKYDQSYFCMPPFDMSLDGVVTCDHYWKEKEDGFVSPTEK